MKRLLWRLRMALGGAVCGAFAGILLGAVAGVVVGALERNWAHGLDGALIGGGIGVSIGALSGLALGWRDVSQRLRLEPPLSPDDHAT